MAEPGSKGNPYSSSFSGALANILFATPADPDRDGDEQKVVARFEGWIKKANSKRVWAMALMIDETIIPLLSGKNLLYVARLIEDRAPGTIVQMRNLRHYKEHLERSAEMAEILSPAALDRLIAAVGVGKNEKGSD